MKPMSQWYSRCGVVLGVTAAFFVVASCTKPDVQDETQQSPHDSNAEQLVAEVQERFDFDSSSFTQGLELAPDGTLYVGTGQPGLSLIHI